MSPEISSIVRSLRSAFHVARKGHLVMAGEVTTAEDIDEDDKNGLHATTDPRQVLIRACGMDSRVDEV